MSLSPSPMRDGRHTGAWGENTARQALRRAFTLIELLVVIAIIGLLISIILPALSRAREIGRRTVCATNLREIATAFWHYAEDHDGWYPAKGKYGEANVPVHQLATVQQFGTRNPTTTGWGLQFAGMIRDIVERDHTHNEASSPKYLPLPKILICPSDVTGNKYESPASGDAPQLPIREAKSFIEMDASTNANAKPYSYMYVALWRNDEKNPYFMMGDESNKQDNTTNSLTGLTEEDNHGRRGINALFTDTHVEWTGARGGDFNSLQELAWKLWGPAVLAKPRYPETPGESRSAEVQTID